MLARRMIFGLAALVAAASCAGRQVTMLGPRRPARPAGCAVQIVPGAPAGPVVDLASAHAKCLDTARDDCLEELRRQTCQVGGDTVYGLSASANQHITTVTATLASRDQPASAPPGSSAGGAAGGCVPICSPGFDCQAGQCIPLCNPACAPDEICNRHRTCEPKDPPRP